jgi:hypothetical protein
MAIGDKLQWMQDMTGVYPDVLLWPEEREEPSGVNCSVFRKPLSDPFQPGAHSREGMRRALDILVANHLNY